MSSINRTNFKLFVLFGAHHPHSKPGCRWWQDPNRVDW